jgi:hypothetical protein
MKKLIFILCLMAPAICFTQEYSEVVQVEGKTTDQLYIAAREWFVKTFVSANDVLQMDDPVAGKLIGKGNTVISESYTSGGAIKFPMVIEFKIDFTISVAVRDGRYKCDINNIFVQPDVRDSQYKSAKMPLFAYFKNKDYYKNGSDADWLVANGDTAGYKITKSMAKQTCVVNHAYYNMLVKTDEWFKNIMLSLQEAMKTSEADW